MAGTGSACSVANNVLTAINKGESLTGVNKMRELRQAKPKTKTEVDSKVVSAFMNGSCMDFAMALHETFGYGYGYVYVGDNVGKHVVGVCGDKVVDVRGVQTIPEVLDYYSALMKAKFVPITEQQLRELCDTDGPLVHICESNVKYAKEVIAENRERYEIKPKLKGKPIPTKKKGK